MTQCIRKRFSLHNFPVKVQFNFVELRKDEFSFFRESSIHFLSGEAPRIRYDGRFLNVIGRKGGITEVFEKSLITVVVDQYFRLQSANAVERIMSCGGNFALLVFMYLTDSENYLEVT